MTSLLANHNVMQIDKIGTKSISSFKTGLTSSPMTHLLSGKTGLVRPVWVETSDIF